MNLGERLKQLRTNTGLTQSELSVKLNIPRGTYAHYELDKRDPNYEMLTQIASFFNVSVDYLLGSYNKNNNNESSLSTKEKLDIAKDLDGIKQQLLDAEGVMFDGMPMDTESIESVIKALELGLDIARAKNKENYNPNKYKK